MKPDSPAKAAKKQQAVIKKIMEKKFSRAELEKLEVDRRIAMLEAAELPSRLRDVQLELDNVIVDCRTLGTKAYELRTDTIPTMERRMQIFERMLYSILAFNIVVTVVVLVRFYG